MRVHDNALSSKLKTCTTLAMGPWRWRVRWILVVVVAVIVTVTAMAAQGPILLATDVYYWDVITAG